MIRDTSGQDQVLRTVAQKPRWRRWLLPAVIGAVVLLCIVFAARSWMSGTRSVDAERLRIAEVTRGDFLRDVAVNGKVVAAVSPTLHTPVIATVGLKTQAGATVKKGDVLVELDSPELTNELQREQSTLQQMEAEAGSARIAAQKLRLEARREADEANINLVAAQREVERAKRAYDAGVLAQVEYAKSKDALDSASVRQRNASSSSGLTQQSAGFDLETKRQQAERQRLLVGDLQRRVDELKVRSPIDGIIGTVSVADRATVAANAPLLTVVDLSRLEVELTVPESYAEDLGLGMPVDVAYGGSSVKGTLSAISPEVVGNEVVVRVRFNGKQPDGLRQNQRVSARILMDQRPDVLMVARGPFLEQSGGASAYVMDGNVAVRRPIKTGATSVGKVEILDGLKVGDRVVISGSDSFGDNERVKVSQ